MENTENFDCLEIGGAALPKALLRWEKPALVRLTGNHAAFGDCRDGSGDTNICQVGNLAGFDCNTTGNSAAHNCKDGSMATAGCSTGTTH